MSDKGRGLRETKETGKIRESTDFVFDPTKHRIRHVVHLGGGHTGGITSLDRKSVV